LAILQQNWQVIRDEGLHLQQLEQIKAADKYNDAGFNSFFKTGWKRFYLKWYEDAHPSASQLCPQTTALLRDIEVRVYDLEDEDNHQEFTCHSDDDCDDKGCYLCPRNLPPLPDGGTTLKWRLSDAHSQYGILLATLPVGRHLSHDQQQLVDTLVEQLTSTLALDRHQEKQQQLIVMEERAT
ncbi:aspartyl/asparaginyl beta-hydroxylase domain-containing protein, partial [Catenulispora yoronensis]|uniref:aspartyl/asparaginyl beta-hydroxylase domain-containing protein n=1 Tax=Catenulispora yoronensis TaxID=450799 RepID=UPI0031DA652A